jgi:hypothetical protein
VILLVFRERSLRLLPSSWCCFDMHCINIINTSIVVGYTKQLHRSCRLIRRTAPPVPSPLQDIRPVWILTYGAATRLSCGGRFGRHSCGTPSVARCGIGGGDPNRPILSSLAHSSFSFILLESILVMHCELVISKLILFTTITYIMHTYLNEFVQINMCFKFPIKTNNYLL